jgi:Uma2 family endonuclease
MNPLTGGFTGSGNQEISRQLGNWYATHEEGRVFGSNTAFRLPDGSILSPDASYLSEERLRTLPKGGLRGFPPICPDFVIELVSESDPLQTVKAKMNDWIANGVQLAWLINPYERQVLVFRPGRAFEIVSGDQVAGEGPVDGLILDLSRVWRCYED